MPTDIFFKLNTPRQLGQSPKFLFTFVNWCPRLRDRLCAHVVVMSNLRDDFDRRGQGKRVVGVTAGTFKHGGEAVIREDVSVVPEFLDKMLGNAHGINRIRRGVLILLTSGT